MAGELISDGKYILINTEYAEAYVPEELIDSPEGEPKPSSVGYEYGDGFVILGICYMRFYGDVGLPRDSVPLSTLIYPNMIETKPTSFVKSSKLSLNDGEEESYRVLQYYRGDVLMEATSRKSSTNCESFLKLLSSGKIPRSLTYDEVYKAWMDNYLINGMTPKAPAVTMQAIVAELYRDPNNPANQFSRVIGKNPKIDPRSYMPVNMNGASAYSSVMSALSFERFSEKLVSSINMVKAGVPQRQSPLEAVITM